MASNVAASSGRLLRWMQKTYYNLAGFNQMGLMTDDTLRLTPDVVEAVRRLPPDVYNQRAFRIKRALDLSLKHRILPQEEWTKFEEDVRYLKPYLEEVQREMKEKAEWNAR
ncbi:Cytochrome b-c1 complex subunit 7 [Holothuria leucospilota]|uniref:Cytochrome b-c1 complex subunit 7 n=1 Tax=Holothuria leucospilota TaxID=206669 RepID=A0A9Q1BD10_HOLLE|nr:Cytochrome b-c1 complex subunit 7 [Holothuria leucospilota]